VAKKSTGSPLLIGVAIVIGLIASIPKEVWIGLLALGAAIFVFRYFTKAKPSVSAAEPTEPRLRRSDRLPGMQMAKERFDTDALVTITLSGGESSSAYRIPTAPAKKSTTARWIPPSQGVTVAGFELPGGMLYIDSSRNTDPSFIVPNLKVSASVVDVSLPLTDYWPNYSSISPDARKGYLSWLSGGRKAPLANIGYVFLFFYGLERRVLLDAPTEQAAHAELPAICAEIQRLLKLYGENGSFRRYATQLVSFIASINVVDKSYLAYPPSVTNRGYELPLGLRIGLGQLAVDQKPVPADWALSWALSDPNIILKTPATRCAELFSDLFKQKYMEAYGDGFMLKVNKTKLRASYYAASSSLNYHEHSRTIADLPDVSAVSAPVAKLQKLVVECTEELDPYSRYLGRNPDKGQALEGLLQLPVALWPAPVRAEIEDLKIRVSSGLVVMTFGELSGRLKSAGALTRDKVLGLARALESLHLGIEPDVLAGNKTPKAEDAIALFDASPESGDARTTPAYTAAVVTLDLACAAAFSDGQASAHELLMLTKQIDSWAHLNEAHRKRLKAHLRLGMNQPQTLVSLKKKLETLPSEAKRSIGRFVSHLAQSDGEVAPAEVKFLERVYKTLGIEAQQLYSDLHTAPAGNVTAASPSVSSIPKQEVKAGFVLDTERIAKLQKETEAVSAMLAGIFVEEHTVDVSPATPTVPEEPQDEATASILGLNIEHSAFVRLLISRHIWPRRDLSDVAADLELMLDGALEHINETILDLFDAPLTEGDDPIEINQEILEKLPV
jgi:uncharacterized tellurite resistance protein B-like protein